MFNSLFILFREQKSFNNAGLTLATIPFTTLNIPFTAPTIPFPTFTNLELTYTLNKENSIFW